MSRPLDIGDRVPSFSLPDQDGQTFVLDDALQGGVLVVFFYPQDETPTCTKEACSFRDANEDFLQAGATVVGISGDSVASHKGFADNHRLKYRLLADVGDRVRKDVFRIPGGFLGLRPGRATYVIDAGGVVRHRYQKHLEAQAHVDGALAVVRALVTAKGR